MTCMSRCDKKEGRVSLVTVEVLAFQNEAHGLGRQLKVGKVLALKTRGPEVNPQHPGEEPDMTTQLNPGARETEAGRSLVCFVSSWPVRDLVS